ncbi:MAG: NAD(P)-dependent oxidoreductase [Pseudomonadota bacterium]
MENIGVIGLGRMGSAMAQRLAAQGQTVAGWTRSGRHVDGIPSTPDLSTLVSRSDTLILSLFDDTAVADTLDQLLTSDLTSKQIIETSTVVPAILQDRITAIEANGATAVDAPISGGPELVLSGGCGIFIGGTDDAATRAQATLTHVTDRIFHVGPLGAGLVMKTINNSMLQAYFAGLGDMMPLAKRAGLTLETAIRILSGGPAGVPMVADRIPRILGEDTSVGFAIEAILKDTDVFKRVAAAYGLDAPTLDLFAQRVHAAVDAGLGEADPAAMITHAYQNG